MDHTAAGLIVCLLMAGGTAGCATTMRTAPPAEANDRGVPRCSARAADDLLSLGALQCWFDAPHGRWRTLSHESHFAVLVVHIEASSLRDADVIARRFVNRERNSFSEILIYAQPESTTARGQTRRVSWTRETGFETLEFVALPER